MQESSLGCVFPMKTAAFTLESLYRTRRPTGVQISLVLFP